MSKINTLIVADSINEQGNRITTMMVTFPRIILAELNTHRMFSRNSASSRAIPFAKMVESVKSNPFIPMAWQYDHKGMQGFDYLDAIYAERAEEGWLKAMHNAVDSAERLNSGCSVTKQLCNRLLEPFMWHTVLITATDYENFFNLRCPQYPSIDTYSRQVYKSKAAWMKAHPGADVSSWGILEWLKLNKGQAEIHMMELAETMFDAINESVPEPLQAGDWHIPFADTIDNDKLKVLGIALVPIQPRSITWAMEFYNKLKVQISTAMCARVSYTVVGEETKDRAYGKDVELHDGLFKAGHLSPFEHCAQANNIGDWSGNFKGFTQYRKMIGG